MKAKRGRKPKVRAWIESKVSVACTAYYKTSTRHYLGTEFPTTNLNGMASAIFETHGLLSQSDALQDVQCTIEPVGYGKPNKNVLNYFEMVRHFEMVHLAPHHLAIP